MCSGDQCCPRWTDGKTYPCPSATPGWSECESPTKVTSCLEPPKPCCRALTADCLACSAKQTVEEYCAENPDTVGCSQPCCRALTADCLACSAGQTVGEYCAESPDTVGCSEDLLQVVAKRHETCNVGDHVPCPDENSTMCSCDQCCPRWTDGKTYPCPSATPGWSECESPTKVTSCLEPPKPCCRALTADCLACSAKQTVEQYCAA